MAETISRALRDGRLEGEQSAALTIKDSIASPFGFDVFAHVLSQLASFIMSGKSQSRGLVLVALSHSPMFYMNLLKRRGIDVVLSSKWIQILDCYTDPLGWKNRIMENGNFTALPTEALINVSICKDVKDLDNLYSSVIGLGRGFVEQGKCRFSVAMDSADELLRHVSMSSVVGLLSSLRSSDQISSIFWLLHSDLHEVREVAVLEYLSSMCEEFCIEQSEISLTSASFEGVVSQGLLPKFQFNLQLSEKEQIDRANVVLPFEHQGNGNPIQIYDGRRSLEESKHEDREGRSDSNKCCVKGEIIYYRDSDDELPDSDEDPDDDLGI